MNIDDVCFVICWYDDQSIFRTLHSIPKESSVLVVDGKFKHYEAKTPLTSHDLRIKVEQFHPNTTIIDAPGLLEHEKRNVGLERCKHKIMFSIDSDEWIHHIDWTRLLAVLNNTTEDDALYGVFIKHHSVLGRHDIPPRIIVNPHNWEYHKTHWILRNKISGDIPRVTEHGVIPLIDVDILELYHDHVIRTPPQMEQRDKYQKILRQYETKATWEYQNKTLK